MIYLGADHGGFELKEKIKEWLREWGENWEDCGNERLDPVDDYPEFAFKVAESVAGKTIKNNNQYTNSNSTNIQKSITKLRTMGILACRSAAGMVIAANKVAGVRAVAVFDEESAKHSRTHNDANVVALSGDWLDEEKEVILNCRKIYKLTISLIFR